MMKELVLIAAGLLILTEVSMALLTGGLQDCLLAAGPTGGIESAGMEEHSAPDREGLVEGVER